MAQPNLCKNRYMKVADKEAEQRLDKLVDYLESSGCGHYSMAERSEGDHKYVQIVVDIKVSANNAERKRFL